MGILEIKINRVYPVSYTHLDVYKRQDQMVSPAVTGLIGDCYVNMGNTKEGISYFEKAAKEADNEVRCV